MVLVGASREDFSIGVCGSRDCMQLGVLDNDILLESSVSVGLVGEVALRPFSWKLWVAFRVVWSES